MLGRTHKKIAVALSFAILQPTTVPACLGTMAAGSIGGTVCDVDILLRKHPAKDEEPNRDDRYDTWADIGSNILLTFLFVLVDLFIGNGAVDWFLCHIGFRTIAASAVFALIVVCGMMATHRSFMHSILVGISLSGCLYFICLPLTPAFTIGFTTHILLDLLNKTGICLFWPIKRRFNFNVCASNKTANAILETFGEILCCLMGSFFLIVDALKDRRFTEILNKPFSEGITNLGVWLVFINIVTFFAENANFSLWLKGRGPYQKHDENFNADKDNATMSFMQRSMYILFVLGGALGGLLSYISIAFRGKKYIKNGVLGIVMPAFGSICVTVEWACIYLVIVNPYNFHNRLRGYFIGVNILYLAIYCIAVNLLTFIIYTNDYKKSSRLTPKKLIEFLIAFLGGSVGAFLSINLKGYLGAQASIKNMVIKMLQMHCLMIAMIIILLMSA